MKLIEAARVMAACRINHRRRDTVTNAQLAIDSGLFERGDTVQSWSDVVQFCHDLGLYAYGAKGHTDLKLMLEHIKRTGQSS